MLDSIYNVVVYIIGDLPLHLEFLYSIFTLFFGLVLLSIPFIPFLFIYKLVSR